MSENDESIAEELLLEETGKIRNNRKIDRILISGISILWAVFQLALPKFLILDSVSTRAVHLTFAVVLAFLSIPAVKKPLKKLKFLHRIDYIPLSDMLLAFVSIGVILYIILDKGGIASRSGMPNQTDYIFGISTVIIVLLAAYRMIGPALPIISILISTYAFMGPNMPGIFAFKGVSLTKYISQISLSTEGIYGIPLDVSANTVFLFVLLGALLDKVGAGQFFNDLSFSLLGKYKGGPAKASVVSSGLSGLISGSSIANVVTTGTFTIPLMKKAGYPAKIAAATEVAASTNGQLMPPIMGAAAFIIAEYLGISYIEVIKAAAVPAFVSYFALFYITHLEALKLGLKGLPKADLPNFFKTVKSGGHYLIPLGMLVYELMVMRHSPKLSAFNAIMVLFVVALVQEIFRSNKRGEGFVTGLNNGIKLITSGLINGSRNMMGVALATAAAGIVVGVVSMGIGSMIVQIVEVLSQGNIFLLLFITAVASLILGMGLPTTATYIVMASITVPVIIKLSAVYALNPVAPVAAHLFCFYFGILADDTPPVGLAAYTAAAIAESDPIATGVQGFIYDLRTAVIPFMFVFNPDLVLVGIDNWPEALLIFGMACLGAFAFTSLAQGWFLVKNKWYELPLFAIITLILFFPGIIPILFKLPMESRYYYYGIGLILYGVVYLMQNVRKKGELAACMSE